MEGYTVGIFGIWKLGFWFYFCFFPSCKPKMNHQISLNFTTIISSSIVQSLSHVHLFETPWTAACQASLSITNSQSLFKLKSIQSVIPSNHLILCRPFSFCLQSFSTSVSFQMSQFFISGGQEYWSFSFSISPSNEYSGLISFRMDWFNLLAIQGPLNSLCQNHSSKASIFQYWAFFIVKLTSIHDHWKNHSLDQTDLCWQSNVSAF